MSSSHLQPRRRYAAQDNIRPRPTLSQDKPQDLRWNPQSLRKGATFHQSKIPSSPIDDPGLDIRKLSLRSPTCPQKLEELVTAGENRIATLLDGIERRFGRRESAGRAPDTTNIASELSNPLPIPVFLLEHAASFHDPMEIDGQSTSTSPLADKAKTNAHRHLSDSGLGTSISGETETARDLSAVQREANHISPGRSVYSAESEYKHTSTETISIGKPYDWHGKGLFLNAHASEKINTHIIAPLLAQEKLKDYHDLVKGLPGRILEQEIACLRDLEKTLIFLAPAKAKSPASYFRFCQSSIQCIYTAYNHLNEREQRRASDRPYTPNYFVDLVQQVRQYASIMEHSRRRQAEGKKPLKDDYEAGETLRLHGGLSENGQPAELVREKDGNLISLQSGKVLYKDINDDVDDEEDAERSMARKRKCDIGKEVWRACRECGKEFKRSCDLTKHEKTHSRPWKCPEESCKYHTLGWPTEKECDRHVNDKHSSAPALYKCLWKDCAYTSKRESNCKQHMEKTHGYEYVRSKSKKASRLVPTIQTPSSMPSPASIVPSLSTPGSHALTSPYESSSNDFTAPASARTAGSDFDMSTAGSESLLDSPFDFGAGSDHDFIFRAFNGDLQQEDAGFSVNSEVGRGSLDSSMMDQSPTSEYASMLNGSEFDTPFEFGHDNRDNPWPSPERFFDNYNITAQQPTPALSEYDFGKNTSAGASGDIDMQEFNSNDSAPMPFPAQPDMTLYSPPADIFAQTSPAMPQIGGDFELFGERHVQVEGADMIPALGNVGQQFPSTADESFGSLERPLQDYIFE